MLNIPNPLLAALFLGVATASAQQPVLVPFDPTWSFMQPMGAFPAVPPGGDADFDTTWILPQAAFSTQYNGPAFGMTPRQFGDPNTLNSFDSGVSPGPIGYDTLDYWSTAGAEFVDFGDDDADPANGISGLLTRPNSGQRRAAYFRTTFTVPAGDSLVSPRVRYLIDDGAYIYLDGQLVAAANMAATTPVNRDQYAATPQVLAAVAGDSEDVLRFLDLALPAGSTTGGEIPGEAAVAQTARIVQQTLSLSPGQHTLAISVRSNSLTSSDLALALELSAEVGCVLSATASNAVRSNAGTPFNPADDTFSFDVTATAINGGASWTSNAPGSPGGAYDVPVTIGPFPIAQSPLSVTIAAISDPNCTAQITATAPSPSITATPQSYARDLRGTVDPTDDLFTATVNVTSQFASATWNATGTVPAAAAPGTPSSGTYGTPVVFGPYNVSNAPVTVTLVDSATPAVTTNLVLSPPIFLGSKAINGVLSDLLSAGPLPAQWTTNGAVSPTISMANAGGDIWREFRSQVVDLSGAGVVAFNAELIARETSTTTNFETPDAFRAKLIVTGPGGTSEVNLIGGFDTNTNGMINGTDPPYVAAQDEFNLQQQAVTATISNVFHLSSNLPATVTAAQLVVEAKGISGSEFFDVRSISFSDRCAFTAAASNVRRNTNGQPLNTAAHTLEFFLRASSTGLVSPSGWNVSFARGGVPLAGANVTGGPYNTNVAVSGLGADGGAITATITDRGDPFCTLNITINVPGPPRIVGMANLAGMNSSVFSNGPAVNWTVSGNGLEMNGNGVTAASTFTTVPLDLSTVNGVVYFSANLRALDTSTGSNFEAGDNFRADLLLDNGTAVTTRNLVTAYDRAVPPDGQMNGNAAVTLDDFNPRDQPLTDLLDNTFPLAFAIPDDVVAVTLQIRGYVNAASETLRLTDVLFTTTPPVGGGDSDGDGVSDTDEILAGTDPNDARSFFRVTAVTTTAGTSNAEFATVSGRFYQGYTSTDLVTWTRDDANAVLIGDGSPAVWPLPRSVSPRRFLRIAVAAGAGDFPATMP